MTTYTKAVEAHKAIHLDRETVKEWAKATFTREKMAEVALCTATVSLVVVVVFSLHKAMENYIILGF